MLQFRGSQGAGHDIATEQVPGSAVVKNLPANAGDRFNPCVGNGSPLQDSCLGNSMDRGAWRAAVHGVAKSRTRLSSAEPQPIARRVSCRI